MEETVRIMEYAFESIVTKLSKHTIFLLNIILILVSDSRVSKIVSKKG